jgi:hypothetical protein
LIGAARICTTASSGAAVGQGCVSDAKHPRISVRFVNAAFILLFINVLGAASSRFREQSANRRAIALFRSRH